MVRVQEYSLVEGIDVDEKVPLDLHVVIALANTLLNKLQQRVANNNPQTVENVLSRPLFDLLGRCKVVIHLLEVASEVEDHVDGQRLIIWRLDVLDLRAFDDL